MGKTARKERTPRGRWLRNPRTKVTRAFGVRGNYAAGYHTGVDLAVPGEGRIPVVWALQSSSKVSRIRNDATGYGLHVICRDTNGNEWLFAHLSKVCVRPGDTVPNGGLIGFTGATGNATGDHLHLERSRSGAWNYGYVKRPPVFKY